MFKNVEPHRLLQDAHRFMQEEVPYNLFHLITGLDGAGAIRSSDGDLLFAQSPGGTPWLWVNCDLPELERKDKLAQLIEFLDDPSLKGICSDPRIAELFAELYSAGYNSELGFCMDMEAYACPRVHAPTGVDGTIRPSRMEDQEAVAMFLAGFSEDGYGITVEPESKMAEAGKMIRSGGLYVLEVDGVPQSMARIAHRAPRHGRINAVFTPRGERGKGYAGAVVSALCSMLLGEGLVPMLYADLANPSSNRLYQKIGFVKSGQIRDIRFGRKP